MTIASGRHRKTVSTEPSVESASTTTSSVTNSGRFSITKGRLRASLRHGMTTETVGTEEVCHNVSTEVEGIALCHGFLSGGPQSSHVKWKPNPQQSRPYLFQLCELELLERERKAAERRLKAARLPTIKTLQSFDFAARPSVNKMAVLELARCEFIDHHENVLLVGNPGTGKGHVPPSGVTS